MEETKKPETDENPLARLYRPKFSPDNDKLIQLVRAARSQTPPPINCCAPACPQGVVISDTTAVLLAWAFSELVERGMLKAYTKADGVAYARAFDECEAIAERVAHTLPMERIYGLDAKEG